MKLLTKTTLYFLLAMVPVLAAAGLYLVGEFSREINYRSDRELISDEIAWTQYLETEAESGTTFLLKTPEVSIYRTNNFTDPGPIITNTTGYDLRAGEKIPYRQLSQVIAVDGVPYQIILRKSLEQKAALVTAVTRIMLFVFATLFAATLVFNWAISKRLWKPFRRSLGKIRTAELQKMEAVHFEHTSTAEFNELNQALNYMTTKMHKDFMNMKEFTENAAHEMQTPVAVVLSKLELLLQDTNLSDHQVQSILQSATALQHLSKLNEGLLLLAKIENKQYETAEEISLTTTTKKYLHLFDEFISEKNLTVQADFAGEFRVQLHPILAVSLITNLLGNAVKYNYFGGRITIKITDVLFQISNTSLLGEIPGEKLFTRLHTSRETGESSNGLGLAIAKKIADVHGLKISYQWQNGEHLFQLTQT